MSVAPAGVVVDAGQSSTSAALIDDLGRVGKTVTVPRGVVHLGRPEGPGQSASVVAEAVAACADGRRVASIRTGLSGYSLDDALTGRFMTDLMTSTRAEQVYVASDAVTAYLGALGRQPGLVIVAGTGGVVLASNGSGRWTTVGGYGFLLGETFGAYAVGVNGLRRALVMAQDAAHDSGLMRAAVDHFGALASALDRLYASPSPARSLAAFAPAMAELARTGDSDAIDAWHDVVVGAAEAIRTAADQVHPQATAIAASWSGGLFHTTDLFLEPLMERMRSQGSNVRFAPPAGSPLSGAIELHEGRIGELFPGLVRSARRSA